MVADITDSICRKISRIDDDVSAFSIEIGVDDAAAAGAVIGGSVTAVIAGSDGGYDGDACFVSQAGPRSNATVSVFGQYHSNTGFNSMLSICLQDHISAFLCKQMSAPINHEALSRECQNLY